MKHYDRFVEPDGPDQAANATSNHRVLVPLCGKTVDMPFLAEKGEVIPDVLRVVEHRFAKGARVPRTVCK